MIFILIIGQCPRSICRVLGPEKLEGELSSFLHPERTPLKGGSAQYGRTLRNQMEVNNTSI